MAAEQHPQLEQAIRAAAERKATDIFLIPGEPVALRIGDRVTPTDGPPLTPEVVRQIAVMALGEARMGQLSAVGHASTACTLPGVAGGQLTAAYAGGRVVLTVRVIPSRLSSAEDVGMPPVVLELAKHKSGLILFNGAVGSGKTTTAYALLGHVGQTQERLICTVEEPIAFAFTGGRPLILQREVGTDVPDTLAGIAASVVQDADVIFVGELKSPEEAAAAVHATTLNRLVLTQTHAPTAGRGVRRLTEIQPPESADRFRRTLADALLVSVGQTLLPRADGRGRVAAYDVLVPDDAFRRALAAGENPLRRPAPPAGSRSMAEHVRELEARATISPETAAQAVAHFSPLCDPAFWG